MISSISTTHFPLPNHAGSAYQQGIPHEAKEGEAGVNRVGGAAGGQASEDAASSKGKGQVKEEGQRSDYTDEEQKEITELKARDREVRAHEAAHQAAGGKYVRGGASFTYERGPDGVNYAVGGEVSIDTSAIPDDPEATLRKAETVRAAALAPAEPSSQDISVAAEASQMAAKARADILAEKQETQKEGGVDSNPNAQDKVNAYGKVAQAGEERHSGALLNTFA